MVFVNFSRWFPMIDNDWSNDGMVMIQRYGLGQQQVAVDAFLSSAAAINHLFLREPRGPKVKCPPIVFSRGEMSQETLVVPPFLPPSNPLPSSASKNSPFLQMGAWGLKKLPSPPLYDEATMACHYRPESFFLSSPNFQGYWTFLATENHQFYTRKIQ